MPCDQFVGNEPDHPYVRNERKVKRDEPLKKELLREYGKEKLIKLSQQKVQDSKAFVHSLTENQLSMERACLLLVSHCRE